MSDRLEALRAMLAEDPDDPFTRYALAMELKGRGEAAEARRELAALIERAPDYVASYYQYAALLHAAGEPEAAKDVIARGIPVAERAGDDHARRELEDLLEDVEDA